ncbi:Wings apart-like protein [Lachnellula hyalina]|uniref:Wings apart-like protein n=1 Tax=Lachnellula hyalina TaxID=1316788 RepID=A0A8H8R086_9HELO|nr:Wings apart-like protein [Lachnellula hyalina]TVY25385.1 Wings apart-like protein [Lachnellula hyalina]
MATLQGIKFPPKKKIATYGKTVRRRIPDRGFDSQANNSQIPEVLAEHELRESPSSPPPNIAKLKSGHQRSISRPASPPSPVAADIFDVPVSDDDVAPRRTPKPAKSDSQKTTLNRPTTKKSPREALELGNNESRKRLKLSPAPKPIPKPHPAKIYAPKSAPISTTTYTKQRPQAKGQTSTMVARPKPKPDQGEQGRPCTPQKINPLRNDVLLPSTPSPQLSDVDMMDVDPEAKYISPRGLKMWQGLLDSGDATEENPIELQGETIRAVGIPAARSMAHSYGASRPSGVVKHPMNNRPKMPRRRLIDSLVQQVTHESSEEDSSEDSGAESMRGIILSMDPSAVDTDITGSQALVPEPAPAVASGSQGPQNAGPTGPKFTYSRQRSMLAEEDLMAQLALDMPIQPASVSQGRRPRRGSIPSLQPLANFHEEEEDEEGKGAAIRSVHELRQAGANSRFLDEIEDLLDRIGNPNMSQTSMRRSGLLDMASKMKDKTFARQFRANGVEQKLFLHLGQENDIISGYLMVSLLISVIVEGSVPHIVPQLRRQGIARLLIRLLDCQASIYSVAKERKSNMSKIGQKMVLEYHDYLRDLPMWEDLQSQTASPRTVALKCLELMVRQTREAGNDGDIFSKELTTKLFSIVKSTTDASWDLPKEQQAIDFYLALSALESHSIAARTVHDENIWITNYLPIIADTLEVALTRPIEQFGVLQILILRLTLNVTNNNPLASDVFARGALMSAMGQAIVAKFKIISRFLTEEDFSVAVDHLVLILGVMINFAEWSSAARESLQSLEGESRDPLDSMVQTLTDNQERISEADSVEETQKNVAFGYLSVLLGYFCLLPEISNRVQNRQPKKTLRPLLSSIEEFIGHHKTVDEIIAAGEDGHNPQSGLTERLESLVDRLGPTKGAWK